MLKHYYDNCTFCPRNCGINRNEGETGYCGETADLRISVAAVHYGEEPPLIGTGGSGTIFVGGCNLGCVFCQCHQVSHGVGKEPPLSKIVSAREFARLCIALRDAGAENINIVTGSHAVPAIIEGFIAARKAGVQIPFLWNSSGYDSREALELLKDHIDIYLPDLKTTDTGLAKKFFNAPDYPAVAKAAILKMIDNAQKPKVIVRHLILPGYLESTRLVLQWFAENIKERALLSLMTQYTPVPGKEKVAPKRYVIKEEYETVMNWLEEYQIKDGFFQELLTGNEWLPDFKRENPFPAKIAAPVWSSIGTD
ncbi:MAG: radical SAM protein [Treponema sp.]|nr:radical SAM protein [Treponema sp.]